MKTPDNFLTPTQASSKWGITRQWLWQKHKTGAFKDKEIYETPRGILFSCEGMERVFGPPQPGRIAPNSKRGRSQKIDQN